MKLLNSYEQTQPENQLFYAFLEAMLWASSGIDAAGTDFNLDDKYSFEDINQQSADLIKALCDEFISKAGNDAILEHNYQQAGHDLFLTIAGHGCGFWDGDWPVNGDALDTLCKSLVAYCDVYDDDNEVYFSYSVPHVEAVYNANP